MDQSTFETNEKASLSQLDGNRMAAMRGKVLKTRKEKEDKEEEGQVKVPFFKPARKAMVNLGPPEWMNQKFVLDTNVHMSKAGQKLHNCAYEIARFTEDTALHAHNDDDLFHRLRQLIGEDPKELLEMTGLDVKAQASAIRLAHFAILTANETLAAQPVQRDEASREAFQDGPSTLGKSQRKRPTTPRTNAPGQPPRKQRREREPDTSSESDSDEDDLQETAEFIMIRPQRLAPPPPPVPAQAAAPPPAPVPPPPGPSVQVYKQQWFVQLLAGRPRLLRPQFRRPWGHQCRHKLPLFLQFLASRPRLRRLQFCRPGASSAGTSDRGSASSWPAGPGWSPGGLQPAYYEKAGAYEFMRKLMVLHFLPAEHIRGAFVEMGQQTDHPLLVQLMEYMEGEWLRNSVWTVEEWSVYYPHNDTEGYHTRLNRKAQYSLPFYILVDLLHTESQYCNHKASFRISKTKVKSLQDSKRKLQAKLQRIEEDKFHERTDLHAIVDTLNDKIKDLEKEDRQLQESLMDSNTVTTFYEGRYLNEIRKVIINLLSPGASIKKVDNIINTVVTKLAGETVDRLPSQDLKSRQIVEARILGDRQVAEAIILILIVFAYLKSLANLEPMKVHLTGALAHGQKKAFIYAWTPKFHMDTNITVNVLIRILLEIAKTSRSSRSSYILAHWAGTDGHNYNLDAQLYQIRLFALDVADVVNSNSSADAKISHVKVHVIYCVKKVGFLFETETECLPDDDYFEVKDICAVADEADEVIVRCRLFYLVVQNLQQSSDSRTTICNPCRKRESKGARRAVEGSRIEHMWKRLCQHADSGHVDKLATAFRNCPDGPYTILAVHIVWVTSAEFNMEGIRLEEAECTALYMNGTFKSCPRPYTQFLTIHGLYHERVVPFVMGLLAERTIGAYRQILLHVKARVRQVTRHHLRPRRVVMDFEVGLMTATETEFPRATISGCHFHFCQSLWRRIHNLGLAGAYKEDRLMLSTLFITVFNFCFQHVPQFLRKYNYISMTCPVKVFSRGVREVISHYLRLPANSHLIAGDDPVISFRYSLDRRPQNKNTTIGTIMACITQVRSHGQ
uniref:Uncharacterized protein n=1 Tax=Branchiostoma floridae TaxID=7739 RepID=C3Y851_BRAFL|eukprot:XP_002607510.1 hypothetical protein BRAFLDRAFT_69941 [Branchiostoma floridae]